MITVNEAQLLVHQYTPDWGVEKVTLSDANDQVLAQDLVADRAYPPIDRVMMDGIAVNFDEYQKDLRVFEIKGICPAGEPRKNLSDNQSALEVMTGAPLPKGADLVIQYEHLKIENKKAHIIIEVPRERFESVHLNGSDCQRGDIILKKNTHLNGPIAGIAASLGYEKLIVKRIPKIMLISTGDELVEINKIPADHELRRSNVYALMASLRQNGFIHVDLAHLKDDPIAVANHYQEHASKYDVLIYSGGVSKGKFDYLPNVWCELGVTKYFHEVSQRPGKPLWFGVDKKLNTMVLGLPGNPVSSLVCLHRYFIPHKNMYVRLTEEVVFKKDLTYFLPVKIEFSSNGVISATPIRIKNSGEFSALSDSDGFIELPRETSVFKEDEAYPFYPWRHL